MQDTRAQVSLEYLLVCLALLGFLGLVLPGLVSLQEALFFAFDAGNAEQFSFELSSSLSRLSLLGPGTTQELEITSFHPWLLELRGEELVLRVELPSRERAKEFHVPLPASLELQGTFREGANSLFLEKTEGTILLSLNSSVSDENSP